MVDLAVIMILYKGEDNKLIQKNTCEIDPEGTRCWEEALKKKS